MKLQQISLTPDDLVFFLHIPKTAGTSLYKALERKFPLVSVLKVNDKDLPYYFNQLCLSDVSHIQFTRQHASYDYKWNFPQTPYIITMLRNPIDRAFSFYQHVCNVKHHGLHKSLSSKSFDPHYFVTELATHQISNLQTRMIVGYLDQQNSLTPQDLLSIAKMRIDQFSFFGLQERYSDSMALLKYIFGWKSLELKKVNVSQKTIQKFDDETIEFINEVNQLDNQLFMYASNIFDSVFSEYKKELGEEY